MNKNENNGNINFREHIGLFDKMQSLDNKSEQNRNVDDTPTLIYKNL